MRQNGRCVRPLRASLWLPLCAGGVLVCAPRAWAQLSMLVTDRTNDSVYFLHDDNNNLVIDEPGEVTRWFGAGNASGLPGVLNPNTIGYPRGVAMGSAAGVCLIGDQDASARKMYWTRDLNGDGDAMDAGEAGVFADTSSGVGQWFAFPTGVAYDGAGVPFVVNAGNGFGPDAVWRCADGNADLDANDAGETTSYCNQNNFSLSNGAFSPQEVVFSGGDLYLRNSSANLHGIWKLSDLDHSGMIDAAAEMVLWFGLGNASGHTPSAGFAIDADPVRAGAFYYHSLATGAVDEVYRVTDVNHDGDGQDAGEAVLVWSTNEANFTSVDVCALADGSVLVTDNSGKRIIRLADLNGDGLFTGAGERTTFLANSLSILGDVRNIAVVRDVPTGPVCDSIDFNHDGLFPDTADIDDFLSVFSGGPCSNDPQCGDIDFNNDGLFPDTTDIDSLLSVFSGGACI
ncbi:MAG: hypothetical protein U0637_10055 [Phycisphaerales bacterium]